MPALLACCVSAVRSSPLSDPPFPVAPCAHIPLRFTLRPRINRQFEDKRIKLELERLKLEEEHLYVNSVLPNCMRVRSRADRAAAFRPL